MPSLSLLAVLAYIVTIAVIVIGFILYWRSLLDPAIALQQAENNPVVNVVDDVNAEIDEEREARLNDPRRAERRALKRERKVQIARMREVQQYIQDRREEARRQAADKREARLGERFDKLDLALEHQRAVEQEQLEMETEARREHEHEARTAIDDILQSTTILNINSLATTLNVDVTFICSHLQSYSGIFNSDSQWMKLDDDQLQDISKSVMSNGRLALADLSNMLASA